MQAAIWNQGQSRFEIAWPRLRNPISAPAANHIHPVNRHGGDSVEWRADIEESPYPCGRRGSTYDPGRDAPQYRPARALRRSGIQPGLRRWSRFVPESAQDLNALAETEDHLQRPGESEGSRFASHPRAKA